MVCLQLSCSKDIDSMFWCVDSHDQRTCLLSTWSNRNPGGIGTRIGLTTKSGGSMQVFSRVHTFFTMSCLKPFGISFRFMYRISIINTGKPRSESKALIELVEASVETLRI